MVYPSPYFRGGVDFHAFSEVNFMRASASLVIDVPIQTVFDFVADIENMERWINGVTESKRTSGGELGVGSTFESYYTYAGKTHSVAYRTVEFEPPTRIASEWTSGPFPFGAVTELEPAGDGTRITHTIDAGPNNRAVAVWFAVFGPILRSLMRRQLGWELQSLKELLDPSGPRP